MIRVIMIIALVLSAFSLYAAKTQKQPENGAAKTEISKESAQPAAEEQKPAMKGGEKQAIEIEGQNRNFNMMLILKNKKEKISFVEIRTKYRSEILATEP